VEVSGQVVKRSTAVGSKSERIAVWLETDAGSYLLRRTNGNPFADEKLESLVGKQISAAGDVIGGKTFLMSSWSELE
jgi:hypothetical protein